MISKFCSDDPYVCVVLLVIFISSIACIVYCSVFLFYMKYMSLFFYRSIFLGQYFFGVSTISYSSCLVSVVQWFYILTAQFCSVF